jgi:hypothetical protein
LLPTDKKIRSSQKLIKQRLRCEGSVIFRVRDPFNLLANSLCV